MTGCPRPHGRPMNDGFSLCPQVGAVSLLKAGKRPIGIYSGIGLRFGPSSTTSGLRV